MGAAETEIHAVSNLKQKKAVWKNGPWRIDFSFADSSASMTWVRFQGYHLSSLLGEHPPGSSIHFFSMDGQTIKLVEG